MKAFSVICNHPRCNNLTRHDSGRCTEHFAQWDAERKAKNTQRFSNKTPEHKRYNTDAWRTMSKAYRRAFPLCVNYKDCRGLAEVVDHIKPLSLGGNQWDTENMQGLCQSCHNRKRQSEGVEARERRRQPGGDK